MIASLLLPFPRPHLVSLLVSGGMSTGQIPKALGEVYLQCAASCAH